MNTKQIIKKRLQHILELAKSGKNEANQSSQELCGEISYPFIAGYLGSRLENIALEIQQVLDRTEEE